MTPNQRIAALTAQLPPDMLSVARELGKAVFASTPLVGKRVRLDSPKLVADVLRAKLEDMMVEQFHVICLDARLRVIGHHVIAQGGLSEVHVRPREAFRPAVIDAAQAIIVAHNHPTGDPEPSQEDIILTRRLVMTGEILGIRVVDHVIVASEGHVSLQERGHIDHGNLPPGFN